LGCSLQQEPGTVGAAHEDADVPDPGTTPVGVAARLDGSSELTEARHRMQAPRITPSGVGEKAQRQAGKATSVGR
jgi:hypothetical protein